MDMGYNEKGSRILIRPRVLLGNKLSGCALGAYFPLAINFTQRMKEGSGNMKKKLLWIIPILLILALGIAVFLCWDMLIMYIAPQTVLRTALNNAIDGLDSRYQRSPVRIIAKGYAPNGQNTTQLVLNTSAIGSREICYDMNVQTDLSNNQVLAKGIVSSDGKELDISAYLDGCFMAISSDSLLKGGFYGITYETFSDDLRGIPLVSLLVPNAAMEKWAASVSRLQIKMNQPHELPQIPDISIEQLKKITLAILPFRGETSREEILVNNQLETCYKLTYKVSGQQLGSVFGYLLDTDNPDSGQLTAAFYLYEKALVKVEFIALAEPDRASYVLSLGPDAGTDDLSIGVSKREKGERSRFSASVSTRVTGETAEETICFNDTAISYVWENSTGDMRLTLPDRDAISLNLSEAESGFRVMTQDFGKLMGWSGDKTYDCTMTIRKGSEISIPEYKNLDQWSLDDLKVLLGGIGSLIGIWVADR